MTNNRTIKSYNDYKQLSEDEKAFWQFEQLSKLAFLEDKVSSMTRKINFIYAWSAGVASAATFLFFFVKEKLLN